MSGSDSSGTAGNRCASKGPHLTVGRVFKTVSGMVKPLRRSFLLHMISCRGSQFDGQQEQVKV